MGRALNAANVVSPVPEGVKELPRSRDRFSAPPREEPHVCAWRGEVDEVGEVGLPDGHNLFRTL
jgi:hypothetical protein